MIVDVIPPYVLSMSKYLALFRHCTKERFASLPSGGFTNMYGSNKSIGKETGKTHLCALH